MIEEEKYFVYVDSLKQEYTVESFMSLKEGEIDFVLFAEALSPSEIAGLHLKVKYLFDKDIEKQYFKIISYLVNKDKNEEENILRNIFFLDVDGVLNIQSHSYTTAMMRENLCEPHLVQRLNYLCGKIENLEIVISSSWRRDMMALEEMLKECGFKYWNKVIDRTSVSAQSDSLMRGEQIWQWLRDNISETFHPGIDANVFILDDEAHGIKAFWKSNTYYTDCAVGITDEIVTNILENVFQR